MEKNKRNWIFAILIFIILLISSFFGFNLDEQIVGKETIELNKSIEPIIKPESFVVWKDNCQTRCVDGECNRIVGRTFYANDTDNVCKPIEEAGSLMNSPLKLVVESDGEHLVEVIDYNLTSVKLRTSIKDKVQKKNVSLKVLENNINHYIDEKTGKEIEEVKIIEKNTKNFVYNDKLLNKKEYEEWIQVNFSQGEYVKFGINSSTIILQDANTENLDDTYVTGGDPASDNGALQNLRISPTSLGSDTVIKFYLEDVLIGNNITFATVNLYVYQEYFEVDEGANSSVQYIYPYPTYNISNEEWTEGNGTGEAATAPEISYNTLPIAPNQMNSTFLDSNTFSDGQSDGWLSYIVTSAVKTSCGNGDKNISLLINGTDAIGTAGSEDSFYFRSKEYAGTSKRPYLNVTYVILETTPPTYSNNVSSTTSAGMKVRVNLTWDDENYLIFEDNIGQYIFSTNTTGVWVNESAVSFSSTPETVSNYFTLNSTVGIGVAWCYYASDWNDNWNNTNCENPFIITTTSTTTSQHNYLNYLNYGHKAYEGNGTELPTNPWTYVNEANTTEYGQINTSDNNRWVTSLVSSNVSEYDYQIFHLNISQNYTSAEKLDLLWEGHGANSTAGFDVGLYVWNITGGAWVELNSTNINDTIDTTWNYDFDIENGIENYINTTSDANWVYILITFLNLKGPSCGCLGSFDCNDACGESEECCDFFIGEIGVCTWTGSECVDVVSCYDACDEEGECCGFLIEEIELPCEWVECTIYTDYIELNITSAEEAAGDDCSCPGVGVSKTFNLSLHCNITSPCTLDTMSFKDTGWINISAIINTSYFNLTGLMNSYLIIDEGSGKIING